MKKKLFLILGMFLLFGIFLSLEVLADASYCCEKLNSGGWCMNAPESDCSTSYRKAPTSCESTSYCKQGTCINAQEGTCMENTPERVCNDAGGVWKDESSEDIAQCQLGCCLVGNQAAFVTQTRCKRLSSFFGLETNFRTDINSELQCITSASADVKGACVFEKEFEKTCKVLSKKDCQNIEEETPKSILNLFDDETTPVTSISFYEGRLCSDTSLGTNCGPTEQTTCVEGKDEVYFVDSCGNIANIYDSTKKDDENYWAEIKTKSESCKPADSNAGSSSCGNCDYYLGSTCKEYERGEDRVKPSYGENICGDLSCEYDSKTYQHGEKWCADANGIDKNFPGSRYFVMVCYNGEVTVEPCADYRGEICVESEVGSFSNAACMVNLWQDCLAQDKKKDCENTERRDCKWINSGDKDEDGEFIEVCVPKYAPGFNFWEVGDAEELCGIASSQCVVTYKEGLFGKLETKLEDCAENCYCIDGTWEAMKNNMCISLGDCGSSVNYIGVPGYHNESAIEKEEVKNE